MENFEEQIAEILEVDSVEMSEELESFEAWDSLAVLSIIALCDDEYGVVLSAEEVNNSDTIEGLKNMISGRI